MGLKVSVPVWYDGNLEFLNNQLLAVDSESIVIGYVQVPNGPSVSLTPTTVQKLFVKDPLIGGLYLSVTQAQWQALVRAASQSPAPTVQTKAYTIASAVNTITDAALTGATIVAIWIGGIEQDITAITLSGDVLTFPNVFGIGDTVGVIYYIN